MSTHDNDEIAKDGEVIRVPVTMMDSGPKNAEARRAYEESVERLSDAWRNPPAAPLPGAQPTADTREAALAARDERLANAWRS